MKRTRKSGAAFAALAILSVLAFGAGPGVEAQTFDEKMTVVVVEVPVTVLLDGEPIRGLTREDFRIFDGKKEQQILDFEVIDLTAVPSAPTPAVVAPADEPVAERVPMTARRYFLMLFDLLNSRPQSVARAREAALALVRSGLHPSDLVAVALNAQGGPRLLIGFTPDRRQAEAAIATLGLPQFIDVRQDPLSLTFGDLEGAADQALMTDLGFGGAFLEAMQQIARRQETLERRGQQAMIAGQTRALAGLAQVMNQIQGRKHVVLLSEGFDSAILYGTQDQAERNRMTTAAQENRIYEVDSEELYGDTRSMGDLQEMLQEFRRANCTIQAVDIGGLDHFGDVELGSQRAARADRASTRGEEETLTTMAVSTGGQLYKNTNDLGTAMSDMLEATGVTYLLSFQPKKLKLDGKFRRLRVELKDKPRGMRLVHRPGYYAPKPFSELNPVELQLLTAQHVLGGHETQGFGTEALATAFRRLSKAYVPVLIEIDGPSFAATTKEDVLMTEILVYAIGRDGEVQDFLHHQVGFDLKQGRAELEAGGLKFYGDLDLRPGDYSLRVYVRNQKTGSYSLRNLALSVPDFQPGRPVVLQPFFAEPAGKWLMAREQRGEEEEAVEYPFHVGGESFVPAALPVLLPGEPVPLRLIAYHFGDNPLEVTPRVLTADGEEVSGVRLEGVERSAEATQIDRFSSQLVIDALPPGAYRLEVTVKDTVNGEQASSWSRFEVGGS